MPKVNWNISAGTIDDYDRSRDFKPYDGPIPPAGVYRWKIKKLQYIAGEGKKHPQLRAGLELIPRNRDEKRFETYFIMAFMTVSEQWPGFYVPFLDAIDVSENEFRNGTMTDEEGNIKKIGRWRNTGDVLVKAQLKDGVDQHGSPRKEIGYFMADSGEPVSDDDPDTDEDFDFDENEAGYEDEDSDWDDGV